MKPMFYPPNWLFHMIASGTLLLPFTSQTFPPAPHHVIYGLVRNEYGEPLSMSGAQIIFETLNPTSAILLRKWRFSGDFVS